MRQLAAGLPPQLRAGAAVVRVGVVRVVELVEHPRLARGVHRQRAVARALHPLGLAHQEQLGAEGRHGLAPLQAHVLRHDQDHAVAADGGGHRQRDAGVAAGGLHQRVARADLAAPLGGGDHRQRRAVLDRARGVVALELGQHRDPRRRHALQPHQRGAADAVLDGRIVHQASSASAQATA